MSTTPGDAALEAMALGKRYRRGWALRDCTFELPLGRICALVGPNGAGKSTLMSLAAGLLRPTAGAVRVLGREPGRDGIPPKLAFLAQDKPLYRRFTVDEMLRAGRAMNPDWDHRYAQGIVGRAGVDPKARIGTLSGGERARVALAIALCRRPTLLMLDEPLASLDPLAREDVMQMLMAEVADTGMTVLLSTHVLADIEGVCDHLLLLAGGRVHLAGDVETLTASHRLMIGLHRPGGHGIPAAAVVEARVTGRQETVLVRAGGWSDATGWQLHEPSLEELTMAYLRTASAFAAARPARTRGGGRMIWVAWRQQRAQLLVSAAAVALIAAVVVFYRFDAAGYMRAHGIDGCLGAAEAGCNSAAIDAFGNHYQVYTERIRLVLALLPLVLGMFAGAPLFAREFEQGTHIFAQSQSVGRTRWWTTKLLVGGLPVVAATLLLSVVTAWGLRPFSIGGDVTDGRLVSSEFYTQGVVVAAYTVFALAVGVGIGLLWRNTVVAMALTIGLYFVLRLVSAEDEVRASYLDPVERRGTLEAAEGDRGLVPHGAWLVDISYLDGKGTEVDLDHSSCTSAETVQECRRRQGITTVSVQYHPDDRFWTFQFIESGILLGLSAGLLGVGVWALRRRPL